MIQELSIALSAGIILTVCLLCGVILAVALAALAQLHVPKCRCQTGSDIE